MGAIVNAVTGAVGSLFGTPNQQMPTMPAPPPPAPMAPDIMQAHQSVSANQALSNQPLGGLATMAGGTSAGYAPPGGQGSGTTKLLGSNTQLG